MRNVWLKYTLIRLGLFLGLTILLGLIGVPWIFAAILGAMLSFAFSMVFLSHLRDQMSKDIYRRPAEGQHPPNLSPEYKSTPLRSPRQAAIALPQSLSEITGPLLACWRGSAQAPSAIPCCVESRSPIAALSSRMASFRMVCP